MGVKVSSGGRPPSNESVAMARAMAQPKEASVPMMTYSVASRSLETVPKRRMDFAVTRKPMAENCPAMTSRKMIRTGQISSRAAHFSARVALAAGVATALYGPSIYFSGELQPAVLATTLVLVGLVLLTRTLSLERHSDVGRIGAERTIKNCPLAQLVREEQNVVNNAYTVH